MASRDDRWSLEPPERREDRGLSPLLLPWIMEPMGMCSSFLPAMLSAHKTHPKKISQGAEAIYKGKKESKISKA